MVRASAVKWGDIRVSRGPNPWMKSSAGSRTTSMYRSLLRSHQILLLFWLNSVRKLKTSDEKYCVAMTDPLSARTYNPW